MAQKGFTLLELMVALAIISILLAISYPSYRDWKEPQVINESTWQLQGAYSMARSRSIQDGLASGLAEPDPKFDFYQEKKSNVDPICRQARDEGKITDIPSTTFPDDADDADPKELCKTRYYGVVLAGEREVCLVQSCERDAGDLLLPIRKWSLDDWATLDMNDSKDTLLFNKYGEPDGDAGSALFETASRKGCVAVGNVGRIRQGTSDGDNCD